VKSYYITDRHALGGVAPLLECIRRNVAAGVSLIQIREKDLPVRDLCSLVRSAVATGATILVNGRADIALACGAAGVHLPSATLPASRLRRALPPGFLIGISCHHAADLDPAADFAVFGPVYETPSKRAYGPPQGLARLRGFCRLSPIPVFALGGISKENSAACLAAGAAGVAGITLFQRSG
jgi:thiamine-phosphate pyrophosphorylase